MSISRRFRRFTLEHLTANYFRADVLARPNPVGRSDLPEALNRAYDLRSKYVHSLQELPDLLSIGFTRGDTAFIDNTTMLTFEGLARLARHTIKEYIQRQPKVDTEDYDYRSERAGIIKLPAAPQYWIWKTDDFSPDSVRKRLEGFLSQLASRISNGPDNPLTDISDVLTKIEQCLPNMNAQTRRAALLLHRVFNRLVLQEDDSTEEPPVVRQHGDALDAPCIEAMLLHLLLGTMPEWTLDEHKSLHNKFLRNQGKPSCLKAPRLFRSYLSLALAERYRQVGNSDQARSLICVAVENDPGREELLQLESSFDPQAPIPWRVTGVESL